MAKGGNGIGGFGPGAGKMGGKGQKPMPPMMGKAPRPLPPGVGSPSPMGPGANGPMGAYKKGGIVKKTLAKMKPSSKKK